MSSQSDVQESTQATIVNLAIESWRLARLFERVLSKLELSEGKRHLSQLNWFRKKLDESLESIDCKLVNLEGEVFDIGMAATAINLDEFDPSEKLVVEQMLEPIILGKEGIVKTGTVTLKKVA